MDDDFIKRGGSVGATLAFWMTLALLCLLLILNIRGDFRSSNMEWSAFFSTLFMGLCCSMVIAIPMAGVGYLLGKSAAKCPRVISAFLRGAILVGLVMVLGIYLPIILMTIGKSLTRDGITYMFFLLTAIASCGSLLSGISAIYVRDYRQLQHKRLIPQFTLLEYFIAFTLLAVIISSMTSITVLQI